MNCVEVTEGYDYDEVAEHMSRSEQPHPFYSKCLKHGQIEPPHTHITNDDTDDVHLVTTANNNASNSSIPPATAAAAAVAGIHSIGN